MTKTNDQGGAWTCYAYAAMGVLETCHLKALYDEEKRQGKEPKIPKNDEERPKLNFAEYFPIRCKGELEKKYNTTKVKLGYNGQTIAFMKRLSGGIAPQYQDFKEKKGENGERGKYRGNCAKALADKKNWHPNSESTQVTKFGHAKCSLDELRYLVSTYGAVTWQSRGHVEVIYGYGNDNGDLREGKMKGNGSYFLLKNTWGRPTWRPDMSKDGPKGVGGWYKLYVNSKYNEERKILGPGVSILTLCTHKEI